MHSYYETAERTKRERENGMETRILINQGWKFLHGDFRKAAVPDHPGLGHGQQGKLLHQLFGVQLLQNADQRIQGDNQDKQHVGPGPHQGQCRGDQQIEKVEQGADIVF